MKTEKLTKSQLVRRANSINNYIENYDCLLNSKFATLFFDLMKKHKDDKPKITHNRNNSKGKKGWEEIYKHSLMIQEGTLPMIVIKYTRFKVHTTFSSILKESFKISLNFKDYVEQLIEEMLAARQKIVQSKRSQGIEIENTDYFPTVPHQRKRRNVITFANNIRASIINNIELNPKNGILELFSMDMMNKMEKNRKEKNKSIQIDPYYEESKFIREEFEKVKQKVLSNKEKIHNNKAYSNIKSRLLIAESYRIHKRSSNNTKSDDISSGLITYRGLNTDSSIRRKNGNIPTIESIESKSITSDNRKIDYFKLNKKTRLLSESLQLSIQKSKELYGIKVDKVQKNNFFPIINQKKEKCVSYFNRYDFYYK